MTPFQRLRRWLSLAVLALASSCAAAQTCTNQVGYVFAVSSNEAASAMAGMGERNKATGQYAAQLVLSEEIMTHLANSLAAGCTQRVEFVGGAMVSWTWNLGRTSMSSLTRLKATSVPLARSWTLGQWGERQRVLTGVQDQFLTNDFHYPFDQTLPLNVVSKLQQGDRLDVVGEARVHAVSVGGGIYDQATANAFWSASYFPYLFIGLP